MFQYPNISQPISGFLADNKKNGKVLILINPNQVKKQTQVKIDGTWWYIELMPNTISTILL